MRFLNVRIYQRRRQGNGPAHWKYVASTNRFDSVEAAVAAFSWAMVGEFTGRPAATHGYYIED